MIYDYEDDVALQELMDKMPAPMPRGEERALIALAQKGDQEARASLILHNTRFALSEAMRIWGSLSRKPRAIQVGDLLQEGGMGRDEAITKVDLERPEKLISYGVWWIRKYIMDHIGNNIRSNFIGTNALRWHIAYYRCHRVWQNTHPGANRDPTLDEVWDTMQDTMAQPPSAPEWKEVIANLHIGDVSIWSPVGHKDFENKGVGDIFEEIYLPDPNPNPLDELISKHYEVYVALEVLDSRERGVIDDYYGFKDGESQTLQAIGQRLGITRERVRQIKDRALRKMQPHLKEA